MIKAEVLVSVFVAVLFAAVGRSGPVMGRQNSFADFDVPSEAGVHLKAALRGKTMVTSRVPGMTRTRETCCRLSSGPRASPGDASCHDFGAPESLELPGARSGMSASLIPVWPRRLLMDEAYRNRRAALTYHWGTAAVVNRSTAADVQDDAVNLVVRCVMVGLCEEHLHKP
jgi:hypothetical protein